MKIKLMVLALSMASFSTVAMGFDFGKLLEARKLLSAGIPEEPVYGHTPMAGLPKGFRAAA